MQLDGTGDKGQAQVTFPVGARGHWELQKHNTKQEPPATPECRQGLGFREMRRLRWKGGFAPSAAPFGALRLLLPLSPPRNGLGIVPEDDLVLLVAPGLIRQAVVTQSQKFPFQPG
jgi:hypothetical protein